MGMPIGAGGDRDGVYYFRPIPVLTGVAHTVHHFGIGELWHHRLGHPSQSVLKRFLGHSVKSDFLDKCSVSLRAKQTSP